MASVPAVHGVGAAVTGLLEDRLRLDRLDELGTPGVVLDVEDVDPAGPEPRKDQVTPFHVRMRRVRAQGRAAHVPPEVMELVTGDGHVVHIDDRTVGEVDRGEPVGPFLAGRVQQGDVGQSLPRRQHGLAGGGIEGGIGLDERHGELLFEAGTDTPPML
ncbi:hypothetical protein GCM10017559_64550 [Streptosporangium longisporum]|uniref:Uncharacterized protein n=1 Tax=Streptosporangium longisporum TaxID=46187 RepID=A0ABP6L599_9ACTN